LKRAAGLCLLLIGLAPAAARAQTTQDPTPPRQPVTWSASWPRFAAWEYAGTAVLGVAGLLYDRNNHAPDQPNWQGGILFDNAVRGWLRGGSEGTRASARLLSDRLWFGGSAYPFVVDLPVALFVADEPPPAGPLGRHERPRRRGGGRDLAPAEG
jgi:hypothetical protein